MGNRTSIKVILNMQIHEFNPEIYPRKIWVVKGGTSTQIKERFYGTNGEELDLDDSCDAIVCNVMIEDGTKRLGELIWFPYVKNMTTDKIAHEAVHVAMDIFVDLGCRFDAFNQEPFAYLVGWIAKCIEEVKRFKK